MLFLCFFSHVHSNILCVILLLLSFVLSPFRPSFEFESHPPHNTSIHYTLQRTSVYPRPHTPIPALIQLEVDLYWLKLFKSWCEYYSKTRGYTSEKWKDSKRKKCNLKLWWDMVLCQNRKHPIGTFSMIPCRPTSFGERAQRNINPSAKRHYRNKSFSAS